MVATINRARLRFNLPTARQLGDVLRVGLQAVVVLAAAQRHGLWPVAVALVVVSELWGVKREQIQARIPALIMGAP